MEKGREKAGKRRENEEQNGGGIKVELIISSISNNIKAGLNLPTRPAGLLLLWQLEIMDLDFLDFAPPAPELLGPGRACVANY